MDFSETIVVYLGEGCVFKSPYSMDFSETIVVYNVKVCRWGEGTYWIPIDLNANVLARKIYFFAN